MQGRIGATKCGRLYASAVPSEPGRLRHRVCPIIYGIIGGVGAVIGATIYNLASTWVGGLEVDLS